jgi:hypothetical protein
MTNCGTRTAYQYHIRAKEKPCEACRRANADWMKDYRRGVRTR